jgi:hypothetical protein
VFTILQDRHFNTDCALAALARKDLLKNQVAAAANQSVHLKDFKFHIRAAPQSTAALEEQSQRNNNLIN